MKNINLLIKVVILIVIIQISGCKESEQFDQETIKSEITEKLMLYNGSLQNQTAELWDAYFLNSPNIGNVYNNIAKIGWETFHQTNIDIYKDNPEGQFIITNIEVYPIKKDLAWVCADSKIVLPNGQSFESKFYDTMIKTIDGWRVVVSVVNDTD